MSSNLVIKNEENPNKTTVKENDIPLHNIPVISSLALNSLPPNIKAIPIGVSAGSLLEQKPSLLQTNINNNSQRQPPPPPLKNDHSPSVISPPPPKLESAINIPLELLDQIVNGEISIRALLNNIDTTTSGEVGYSNTSNLVAIDTKMGTIPIIPVKGKGGLQLIPIQQDEGKSEQVQQNTIFTSQSSRSVLRPDAPSETNHFPLLHSTLPIASTSSHSSTLSSICLKERLIPSKSISPTG